MSTSGRGRAPYRPGHGLSNVPSGQHGPVRSPAPTSHAETLPLTEIDTHTNQALFRSGFLAMLPLWAGAIPAGAAYGVAAQHVGLSFAETQLMSVVVFSAAGQVSAISLLADGTSTWLIIGTTLALNIQLLLIGLAVGRQIRMSWGERLLTSLLLTDASYGVSASIGRLRLPVLLGAGVGMFTGWNIGTALGMAIGNTLPDPQRLGIEIIIPLSFLAVLVPMLRTRAALLTAVVAGIVAFVLYSVAPAGVAVLLAGAIGSAAGAWASQRTDEAPAGSAP